MAVAVAVAVALAEAVAEAGALQDQVPQPRRLVIVVGLAVNGVETITIDVDSTSLSLFSPFLFFNRVFCFFSYLFRFLSFCVNDFYLSVKLLLSFSEACSFSHCIMATLTLSALINLFLVLSLSN